MFRFGPSGIPLSCKGRTQRDGIEDVHTLGLNAMEVQFVRVDITERYATDEEIGQKPRDIEGELIVEVLKEENAKGGGKKYVPKAEFDTEIKKGDKLRSLRCGIGHDYHELKELGEIAKDLDLRLSVHTPYYMDLLGDEDISEKCLENIKFGALIAHELGADMLVTHLGFYHDYSTDQAIKLMTEKIKIVRDWINRNKLNVQIGLETSGHQLVFGRLDEILAICRKLPGVVPVLNFALIHARENGSLKRKEDFQDIFDRVRKIIKTNEFYTHFSGIEHEGGNEKRFTPIKKGDMKFEPLAECLLDNDFEVTIISSSPLLEHDAMYMKLILERVQLKREMKAAKAQHVPAKEVVPKRKKRAVEEIELEADGVEDYVDEIQGDTEVEGTQSKEEPKKKGKKKDEKVKVKGKGGKPKPSKKEQAQRIIERTKTTEKIKTKDETGKKNIKLKKVGKKERTKKVDVKGNAKGKIKKKIVKKTNNAVDKLKTKKPNKKQIKLNKKGLKKAEKKRKEKKKATIKKPSKAKKENKKKPKEPRKNEKKIKKKVSKPVEVRKKNKKEKVTKKREKV